LLVRAWQSDDAARREKSHLSFLRIPHCFVYGKTLYSREETKPQLPQTSSVPAFLVWVVKQVALSREVVSGYEAGPMGFVSHRRLTPLGLRNYVACSTRLDKRCRGAANDRAERLGIGTRLDRCPRKSGYRPAP